MSFLGWAAALSASLQRVTKNYSTILIAIISITIFKLPTDLFSHKTTSKETWKWIKISWCLYFFACKLKYFLNVFKAKSLEDILLLTISVLSFQNPSFNIMHNLKKIQVWIALGYSKNGRSQKDLEWLFREYWPASNRVSGAHDRGPSNCTWPGNSLQHKRFHGRVLVPESTLIAKRATQSLCQIHHLLAVSWRPGAETRVMMQC